MALIAVFANVKVRYDQGQIWKANPEITEIAGAMSFSTADAPYFLGHAAAAEKGLSPDEYERKRSYPNAEISYQQRGDDGGAGQTPAAVNFDFLTVTIRQSRRFADGRTHHSDRQRRRDCRDDHAGLWCHGILAGRRSGGDRRRPVIRLSGAIILRADRHRSAEPWIDVSDVRPCHAVSTIKTAVATLIWAVAAGATANIFMAWYGKPELIWMAIAAYAWLLVVLRKDVKIAVLCLLLFYALAPVSLPNPFASAYVQDNFAGGSFLVSEHT